MTVETAVAIAGGFTPRAYTVEVSRPIEGVAVRASLPVAAPLRPGDTGHRGAGCLSVRRCS
jgi:polysaccharide export outer membrane protein